MPILDDKAIVERIDELLATQVQGADAAAHSAVNEVLHGALNVLIAVHGPGSQQQANLLQAVDAAYADKRSALTYLFVMQVWPAVAGALRALRTDVQRGFVGNVQRRAAGEVFADMLSLAKEALQERSAGAKNVAAVLTAATFEDTVRKMGSTFANVNDRRDLADVLTELKKAGILEGAPFTTALSYLKFRNDALHADWDKLDAAVVGSCLTFVEQLVLRHFS